MDELIVQTALGGVQYKLANLNLSCSLSVVGAAELEDDGVPFEAKMRELSQTLFQQMKQAETLDQAIRQNLGALGYGE